VGEVCDVIWERGGAVGVVDVGDFAVVEGGDAIGVREDAVVVGDDEDGAFGAAGDLLKNFHDEEAVFGVESGGGFVADDEAGVVDEGAGDGDALLLATGELGGSLFGVFAEADLFEEGAGFFFGEASGAALDQEGDGGVLDAVESGDEIELLEDETDGVGAEAGDGGLGHFTEVVAEDFELSIVGGEGAGDDADEGGFAATGGADEHGDIATADIEVDAFEDEELGAAIAKAAGDAADAGGERFLRW
jgi:hypothetical protein